MFNCVLKDFFPLFQSTTRLDLDAADDEGEDLESLKSTIRKGLLWQQKDKLFSQWKERYFILTPDYLQCFKKGTTRMTEMGEFIFKVPTYESYHDTLIARPDYLNTYWMTLKSKSYYNYEAWQTLLISSTFMPGHF